MSYGVIASKSGQMLIETTSGLGGLPSDDQYDRFQSVWGAVWVPGRLTLTKLHFTFMPNRVGRGSAMLKLNLRDITAVEISGGRLSKTVGLRTPRHVGLVRCLGAPALAAQIAEVVEEARHAARRL